MKPLIGLFISRFTQTRTTSSLLSSWGFDHTTSLRLFILKFAWLTADLTDQDYFVSFVIYESEWKKITNGVSQRSILRWLLFCLHASFDYGILQHLLPHICWWRTTLQYNVNTEWMSQNFPQLSVEEREVIVFGPKNERLEVSVQLYSFTLKRIKGSKKEELVHVFILLSYISVIVSLQVSIKKTSSPKMLLLDFWPTLGKYHTGQICSFP